jgi:nucleotide-binding universal stress UspA family protein
MKILVAIDLSESTDKIINKARELAMPHAAQVWLLHVAAPEPDFVGLSVGPQSERDALAEKFHREHSELQALADQLREQGLDTTALLVQGPTIETLLHEITTLSADLVVVGSHGKGAMHQLLVGSVSEGVLRKAGCPILVIPTHDRA